MQSKNKINVMRKGKLTFKGGVKMQKLVKLTRQLMVRTEKKIRG